MNYTRAYAVGKLHVYPQRDRIGFVESDGMMSSAHAACVNEEGRHHLGMGADDYELFLAEQGFPGQEYTHGMSNNQYVTRPWHLPEYAHPTPVIARSVVCDEAISSGATRLARR